MNEYIIPPITSKPPAVGDAYLIECIGKEFSIRIYMMLASKVLITTREGSWSLQLFLKSFCILEGKSSPRLHPVGTRDNTTMIIALMEVAPHRLDLDHSLKILRKKNN